MVAKTKLDSKNYYIYTAFASCFLLLITFDMLRFVTKLRLVQDYGEMLKIVKYDDRTETLSSYDGKIKWNVYYWTAINSDQYTPSKELFDFITNYAYPIYEEFAAKRDKRPAKK